MLQRRLPALLYRPPTGNAVQRPAVRIVFTDPRLALPAPYSAHDVLVGTVLHLDDGAISWSRLHAKEYATAHKTFVSDPYHFDIILFRHAVSARMRDRIIDAGAARGLHAYAYRTSPMVGWVVMRGLPAYCGKLVARLVTDDQTAYVLIANTLAGIREQLPSGLIRSERQPSDPPVVVEVWFPPNPAVQC